MERHFHHRLTEVPSVDIGCATLYHLSMAYITVYNLSINSNYRILAAELNYRFTKKVVVHSFVLAEEKQYL